MPDETSQPKPPGRVPPVRTPVGGPARASAQARPPAASVSMKQGRPVVATEEPPPRALSGQNPSAPPREFFPLAARTLEEAGLDPVLVESLLLRALVGGAATGRALADRVKLDLSFVQDGLNRLKEKKLVVYRGTTVVGDFVTELTEEGQGSALQSRAVSAYVGPAPVPWPHYLEALRYQSLTTLTPGEADLRRAFADLQVSEDLLDRLGPAVTSGRALFLHGEPGNGKTSLAERMTGCFGGTVWIPYTVDIGGCLVKLFDPALHEPVAVDAPHTGRYDRRWVRIRRPTVVAGGELTLAMLELTHDPSTNVCEAPVHLKANLGTFVVDDFGRGPTPARDLLNRWIYPLERRRDFLSLPDGRKVAAPFDCLLVFSTNLEPRDLVDEAFLRRIPYKIYVGDPLEDEFETLVEQVARELGITLQHRSVRYLVDRHYKMPKRPMRMCHARDLLLQVVHLCEYERRPATAGPREWDRVVANYFGSH